MTAVSMASVEPSVREQYERLPYPPRDPVQETQGLRFSYPDFLPLVNRSCFSGTRDLREGGRILVAGSGTGDVEIFLAEQVYGHDCEIIALDLSDASIGIARARAAARGLEHNIRWVRGSILDIDSIDLGQFDYITSSGVLHHLEDPLAGLRALRGVLKPDGAMGLMVYGRYGRTAIYQMQDTLRMITAGSDHLDDTIDLARRVLRALPETNWFARSQDLVNDHISLGDAGLVDLLLHPQDRAFTVTELVAWIEAAGMSFLDFSYHRRQYDPTRWMADESLREIVKRKTRVEQFAIAELLVGSLYCHFVYCAPTEDREARISDSGMVPSLWMDRVHLDIAAELEKGGVDGGITVTAATGAKCMLPKGPAWLEDVYREMDGMTAAVTIADRVSARTPRGVTSAEVMGELGRQYQALRPDDMMLLRHESIPPFRSPSELELRIRGLDVART